MTVRGLLCDLDGVVYRGRQACPGAVAGLTLAREAGVRILFITNNASRTPEEVAAQISGLGVPAGPDEVLTSSQVAAHVVVQDHHRPGGDATVPVLAVGGPGVAAALREEGLLAVSAGEVRSAARATAPLDVSVAVQGYGADVDVQELTELAYAVRGGADWVATNDDATLPTDRGLAPGNGSLIAAVAHATGVLPRVVGKPHAAAYDVAVQRLGLPREQCLVIGDRLDTDIAGARRAGIPSALVLTGVSTRSEADAAPEHQRPDHVARTIPDVAHLWRVS